MSIDNISSVFDGATVNVNKSITIPSGSLISCENPVATDPNEIIFGMLENINKAIVENSPQNLTSAATSSMVSEDTYRRTYIFNVDLDFQATDILELLNVKAEPTTTTTTTTAP